MRTTIVPKKKATSPPSKPKTYETFLRSVKLYSLALDEVSAKLNRNMYWKYSRKSEAIIREIKSNYKAINLEDDHFDVEGNFELTISLKAGTAKILAITCTYSAHFHAADDYDEEATSHFAGSEAKVIIWPYFRHLVSDITSQMHIPPINIPLTLD